MRPRLSAKRVTLEVSAHRGRLSRWGGDRFDFQETATLISGRAGEWIDVPPHLGVVSERSQTLRRLLAGDLDVVLIPVEAFAGKLPAPYQSKGFAGAMVEALIYDEAGGNTKQVAEFRNKVQKQGVSDADYQLIKLGADILISAMHGQRIDTVATPQTQGSQ